MTPKADNIVFKCLYIMAWLIFVGLSIEAGGLIVNFWFSVFKPEFIQNLYQKLDLTLVKENSDVSFYFIYSFILCISVLKSVMFYIVITLMHNMDLASPFNVTVSKYILRISYFTISIGLLSLMATQYIKSLMHHGFVVESIFQFLEDGQAFILMGCVIYIIARIFKKGVDIQNEIDLTV